MRALFLAAGAAAAYTAYFMITNGRVLVGWVFGAIAFIWIGLSQAFHND
jgi:hypothetical protein